MSTPESQAEVGEHIPYKITSQVKTQTFTPDGRFMTVWKIGYEEPESGVHAYIEVPEQQYTPANVDRMIEEELEKITGTAALGPEPHPENLAE